MGALDGKVALVTGATNGIGRVCAEALAREGADVTIVARNEARGRATLAEIVEATGNERVDLIVADLSEVAQVRRAAAEFRSRHDRLHVLVNNAGAIQDQRIVTAEGFELTFALNHLAYFVLTNELLDVLKASAPARVVSVSSDAHRTAAIDWDDLQKERGFNGFLQYGNSKLMNLWFAFELAKRLEGTGVTSNAVHPGVVASNFGQNTGFMGWVYKLGSPFMRGNEKGAVGMIHLATSPELEGVTGTYWMDRSKRTPSTAALDRSSWKRLWEATEKALSRVPAGQTE
jgi:NAD(P)-dependent dehydrogenase (short-subunit alcohol dehydrogenase family)